MRALTQGEIDYLKLGDEIRSDASVRDYHQLLSEHALSLIAIAADYGTNGQQLSLLSHHEALQELHQEWAEKVTGPYNPGNLRSRVKQVIKQAARRAIELVNNRATMTPKMVMMIDDNPLSMSLQAVGRVHSRMFPDATAVRNGMLERYLDNYAAGLRRVVDALRVYGRTGEEFYRLAAQCLRLAQVVGDTLDQLG